MSELSLKILTEDGSVKAEVAGEESIALFFQGEYEEGDKIIISSNKKGIYLIVQIDDAMKESFVYMAENKVIYNIPFGEKRVNLSPKIFLGNKHLLSVRNASKEEITSYKNLACNVMDKNDIKGLYPHAYANVETRGEAVFAASNAIDGNRENHSHGQWPYESWGIGMRDDACLTVDFGRKVIIDKVVLYTRSDFPHDSWWTSVTLNFSDNTLLKWNLNKSDKPHTITFRAKEVSWISLKELIKAEDSSPFPALSQIEVYGYEA